MVDLALAEFGILNDLGEFLIEKNMWLPPVDFGVSVCKEEGHELGKVEPQRVLPRRVVGIACQAGRFNVCVFHGKWAIATRHRALTGC
jgi:hypothetical protein